MRCKERWWGRQYRQRGLVTIHRYQQLKAYNTNRTPTGKQQDCRVVQKGKLGCSAMLYGFYATLTWPGLQKSRGFKYANEVGNIGN